MNKFLSVLVNSFILFFISFLLISCSSDLNLTAPPNESISSVSQNLKEIFEKPDTMIYLPLSQKYVGMKKGFPNDKLEIMDKYFLIHNIETKEINKVTPMLPQCGTHSEFDWIPTDEYKAVQNKTLGIWLNTNLVSYADARNLYGFKELHVSSVAEINTAIGYGWNSDSMMYSYNKNQSIPNVGCYYIDEPLENDTWYNYEIVSGVSIFPHLVQKDSPTKNYF